MAAMRMPTTPVGQATVMATCNAPRLSARDLDPPGVWLWRLHSAAHDNHNGRAVQVASPSAATTDVEHDSHRRREAGVGIIARVPFEWSAVGPLPQRYDVWAERPFETGLEAVRRLAPCVPKRATMARWGAALRATSARLGRDPRRSQS
jgi:hypothetical protein